MKFLGKALLALFVSTIAACSGSRSGPDSSEKVGTSSEPLNTLCALGGQCTLVMPVPKGLPAQAVVLSATTALTVSNGARIVTDGGGFGTIANLGGLLTSVGIGATVGNIVSQPSVTLGANTVVHGSVQTGGVVVNLGASVTGATTTHTAVATDASIQAIVNFPASAPPVVVLVQK